MTNKRKETYAESVKKRMKNKMPENLLGGLYDGQPRPHICNKLEYNFIDGKYPKEKCIKGIPTNKEIKYHYAEHLNSSQTMCISYFKKFFEKPEYEALLIKILSEMGLGISVFDTIEEAIFEHILNPKEGTNFDFYLKLHDDRQITFEIKFTESEFGATSKIKDASFVYCKKYADIYVPMLAKCAYSPKNNILSDNIACLNGKEKAEFFPCLEAKGNREECKEQNTCPAYQFYKYYQIRRNILYAEKDKDIVIFLSPEENHSLDKEREYIEWYANTLKTPNIRNIYWEKLLDATLLIVKDAPELFEYYKKFKNKYFE